jgi:hypothetical protein
MVILPLSGPPSTSTLVQFGFSPYIGPHCDPVLVRMKSQCACTSSSGGGGAVALFCWFNGAWFGQVAMLSVFP